MLTVVCFVLAVVAIVEAFMLNGAYREWRKDGKIIKGLQMLAVAESEHSADVEAGYEALQKENLKLRKEISETNLLYLRTCEKFYQQEAICKQWNKNYIERFVPHLKEMYTRVIG